MCMIRVKPEVISIGVGEVELHGSDLNVSGPLCRGVRKPGSSDDRRRYRPIDSRRTRGQRGGVGTRSIITPARTLDAAASDQYTCTNTGHETLPGVERFRFAVRNRREDPAANSTLTIILRSYQYFPKILLRR